VVIRSGRATGSSLLAPEAGGVATEEDESSGLRGGSAEDRGESSFPLPPPPPFPTQSTPVL